MTTPVGGLVQRFFRQGNSSSPVPLSITELGSARVAQVEPPGVETLRAGARFFGGSQSGATFMAGAAAIPTTAGQAQLYNAETGPNAKSYYVDTVGFWEQGGTTVTSGALLFATLTPSALATVPTASGSWTSASASGSSRKTKAIWTQAPTALAAGATWMLVAATPMNVTALLLGSLQPLPFDGILLPPGYGLNFAGVGVAGTSPTYGLLASWLELELDLE